MHLKELEGLLDSLADGIRVNLKQKFAPLEARVAALESRLKTKSASPAPEHAVGEIVTMGGTRFKCVAPNRYRAIEETESCSD